MADRDTSRKDKRSSRTKKAMMTAMFSLLEKRGFQSITVNDICLEAEVSRATFYLYFDDKYDLVKACMDEFRSEVEVKEENDSYRKSLRQVVDYIDQKRKIFIHLLDDKNSELERSLHITLVEDLMVDFKRQEKLGREFDLPIEISAVFCAAGLSAVIIWWITGGFQLSKEQLTEYLLRTVEDEY